MERWSGYPFVGASTFVGLRSILLFFWVELDAVCFANGAALLGVRATYDLKWDRNAHVYVLFCGERCAFSGSCCSPVTGLGVEVAQCTLCTRYSVHLRLVFFPVSGKLQPGREQGYCTL